MTDTIVRRARGVLGLAALAALAACGGGNGDSAINDGGADPQATLACNGKASNCADSSTIHTSGLHARIYVVSDGSHAQAQAGFLDHEGSVYNVALLHGDTAWAADAKEQVQMGVPKISQAFFSTDPYLADFNDLPTTAHDYQVKLVRADGTYTSTVTMPPAFAISAPSSARLADDGLAFSLDIDVPAPTFKIEEAYCTDTAGNKTGLGPGDTDLVTRVDRTHYRFDIAAFRREASPSSTAPLKSCSTLLIDVRSTAQGTPAPELSADSSISAYQSRKFSFELTQ